MQEFFFDEPVWKRDISVKFRKGALQTFSSLETKRHSLDLESMIYPLFVFQVSRKFGNEMIGVQAQATTMNINERTNIKTKRKR